jgi:adenosylcobinamide kinase/adenosylcobinamide-phosphate guanylyltransferase
LQNLALILGGAASGKSAFAEGLVTALGRPRAYIATAQAWDEEMRAKIARHRESRGPGWRTIEAPTDLARALRNVAGDEAVLVDCATLWLSNRMLVGDDLAGAGDELLAALAACPAPVAVVSNEVGLGIVPDTPLGRRFREAQGTLNQRLAAQADLVVLVAAGLPLVLKGSL